MVPDFKCVREKGVAWLIHHTKRYHKSYVVTHMGFYLERTSDSLQITVVIMFPLSNHPLTDPMGKLNRDHVRQVVGAGRRSRLVSLAWWKTSNQRTVPVNGNI